MPRSRYLVMVLTLAAYATVEAQSQPPIPRGGNERQAPQRQASAEQEQPRAGSQSSAPIQTVIVATQPEPSDYAESDFYKALNDWGMLAATVVMAIFSVVLAIFTAKQVRIATQQTAVAREGLETTREIERAYITLGHKEVFIQGTPDGQGGQDTKKPVAIFLKITVKNRGRTPGDVLGGFAGYSISVEPLDPTPAKDVSELLGIATGFLLPDKEFSYDIGIFGTPEQLAAVVGGDKPTPTEPVRLWLSGEVDYRDRFGGLHTCGYGRAFAANLNTGQRPTFAISKEVSAFNFDRPMTAERRQHYETRGQAKQKATPKT